MGVWVWLFWVLILWFGVWGLRFVMLRFEVGVLKVCRVGLVLGCFVCGLGGCFGFWVLVCLL